ncbi:ABC transporter ATP-binding protein [Thermanaeromonas sp. C210]|uniref:ABC transporter ATP-binding protein n=1 Tax=Thermanaeromonas sp. C210 TaxID=2731925 RepID=UPI00155D15DB|nr:ABC transporter ATP-binding protein [Thermanaeromonas sp. C210]GFN22842.1 lipoprotein ABC transporter ATP-binding protein [Thermanaeromonas sp. C210]
MEIRLLKVSHCFDDGYGGKVTPLREIDWTLQGGETYALLGPSGSGKTTLLFILGCLLRPTEGEVIMDGRNVYHLSEDQLSELRGQRIGFVFQRCYLIPTLTVWENLALPAWVLKKEIPKRKLATRIEELLEQFGLKERAGFLPHQLSGGQRRRVALARALLYDPEIILADEPTAEMDEAQRQKVAEWLLTTRRQGKTVVVATHDTWLASQARHIFALKNGKLYLQNKNSLAV